MQIPELEKLASKKFCAAIVGMYAVIQVPLPEDWVWLKVPAITIIAVTQMWLQARLDSKEKQNG